MFICLFCNAIAMLVSSQLFTIFLIDIVLFVGYMLYSGAKK